MKNLNCFVLRPLDCNPIRCWWRWTRNSAASLHHYLRFASSIESRALVIWFQFTTTHYFPIWTLSITTEKMKNSSHHHSSSFSHPPMTRPRNYGHSFALLLFSFFSSSAWWSQVRKSIHCATHHWGLFPIGSLCNQFPIKKFPKPTHHHSNWSFIGGSSAEVKNSNVRTDHSGAEYSGWPATVLLLWFSETGEWTPGNCAAFRLVRNSRQYSSY